MIEDTDFKTWKEADSETYLTKNIHTLKTKELDYFSSNILLISVSNVLFDNFWRISATIVRLIVFYITCHCHYSFSSLNSKVFDDNLKGMWRCQRGEESSMFPFAIFSNFFLSHFLNFFNNLARQNKNYIHIRGRFHHILFAKRNYAGAQGLGKKLLFNCANDLVSINWQSQLNAKFPFA